MPRIAAKLGAVDVLLQVLDAHADGKGLLLHGQTHVQQPLVGIAGAVADGQKHIVARNFIRRPVLNHLGGAYPAIMQA